jgi:hypothetical protein
LIIKDATVHAIEHRYRQMAFPQFEI